MIIHKLAVAYKYTSARDPARNTHFLLKNKGINLRQKVFIVADYGAENICQRSAGRNGHAGSVKKGAIEGNGTRAFNIYKLNRTLGEKLGCIKRYYLSVRVVLRDGRARKDSSVFP